MRYKKPEMEIYEFERSDIVRTSYHDADNPGDESTDVSDW